jgi:hypothetical protein
MHGVAQRREPRTAAEVMAERERRLLTDPEYAAQVRAMEHERATRADALREAEQPLLEDLRAVGVSVDSVWTLRTEQRRDSAVATVLLRHLHRPYPDRVREGLARALTAPAAWDHLVRAYREANPQRDRSFMDGLAATLSQIADRSRRDELLGLLHDRSRGSSRVHLLRAVTRLRLPDRWLLVEACTADPDLRREAEHMLHQRALRDRK